MKRSNVLKPFCVKIPQGRRRKHLLGDMPKTKRIRSGYVTLKPDDSVGEHTTGRREEVIVFLQGRGRLILGKGRGLAVGKGQMAYVPVGTRHNVKNTGRVLLRYVYIVK